jgi:Resolvase, N terminal domain
MAGTKFVSYLRVSTDKQGRGGLGLEAQREAVARYLNGGQWKLVAEYVEVESGKRNSRPACQQPREGYRGEIGDRQTGLRTISTLSQVKSVAWTSLLLTCRTRIGSPSTSSRPLRKASVTHVVRCHPRDSTELVGVLGDPDGPGLQGSQALLGAPVRPWATR